MTIAIDNLDGFGPNGGRWWGVFADGVRLEAVPSMRRAERIAQAYRADAAMLARKLAAVAP